MSFFYVYILTDVTTGTHHYTGCTENLSARLAKHNAGEVSHTSKYKPWCIQTAVAFDSKENAYAFEASLKSGSGREFAKRHGPLCGPWLWEGMVPDDYHALSQKGPQRGPI